MGVLGWLAVFTSPVVCRAGGRVWFDQVVTGRWWQPVVWACRGAEQGRGGMSGAGADEELRGRGEGAVEMAVTAAFGEVPGRLVQPGGVEAGRCRGGEVASGSTHQCDQRRWCRDRGGKQAAAASRRCSR